jgi:hypothetical protein
MHLTHTISPDRRTLTIHADAAARVELRELASEHPAFHSDDNLYDAFEHLICNSELRWIRPEICGDSTDAPILGITGELEPRDESRNGDGAILGGRWPDKAGMTRVWVEPVIERWGYLDYMLRSPLFDLLEKGFAVFTAP